MNIKLKIIIIFFCLLIILYEPSNIYAINSTSTIMGYLTSEDGMNIPVKGFLERREYIRNSESETNVADTYRFEVPSRLVHNDTAQSPDSGYVSTVYLTITYTTTSTTPTEYLLTKVSGYWVITDSQASVENAYLSYCCTDLGAPLQHVSNLSVSNNFTKTTNFSSYIVNIYADMGAKLELHYLYGTSRRWTFSLENIRLGVGSIW